MRFLYQAMNAGPAESRALASQLCKQFEPLEFEGPGHLIETLRTYGEANQLKLTVGMHSGIVNVHGETGILVRIRSLN